MKVLFVAAEAAPFVKVGGLGDVIGSLPKSLKEEGIDARVVLPLYSSIDKQKYKLKFIKYIFVNLGWRRNYCGIFETEIDGIKFYLIDNEYYFNRGNVYGQHDDGERFAFFSRAALEILPEINFQPDIINVNDWHTALSVLYLDDFKSRGFEFYSNIRSVISIHNIEFQGKFNPYLLGDLFGLDNKYFDALIYNGDLNLLKGAIQLADRINTVSETYAHEILEPYFSYGMDSILRVEQGKLHGIINGLDTEKFDPKNDNQIYKKFTIKTKENKKYNKLGIQKDLGLAVDENIPMIGMVTRLTHQKGIDLVLAVVDEILKTGAQLVILGTGDSLYEQELRYLEDRYKSQVRSLIMFSSEVSSKVYAASDLFLMPSKTEPCGLSQMISMRYGTLPIVHRVGGLRDTVLPFDKEKNIGNGFTFESFNALDMLNAIHRALDIYYNDKKSFSDIIVRAMETDVSWETSARKYINMYKEIY